MRQIEIPKCWMYVWLPNVFLQVLGRHQVNVKTRKPQGLHALCAHRRQKIVASPESEEIRVHFSPLSKGTLSPNPAGPPNLNRTKGARVSNLELDQLHVPGKCRCPSAFRHTHSLKMDERQESCRCRSLRAIPSGSDLLKSFGKNPNLRVKSDRFVLTASSMP